MSTGSYAAIAAYNNTGTQALASTINVDDNDSEIMSVFWNDTDTHKQILHGSNTLEITTSSSTRQGNWGGTQTFTVNPEIDSIGDMYIALTIDLNTPTVPLDSDSIPKTLTTLLQKPSPPDHAVTGNIQPIGYAIRGINAGEKKPKPSIIGYPQEFTAFSSTQTASGFRGYTNYNAIIDKYELPRAYSDNGYSTNGTGDDDKWLETPLQKQILQGGLELPSSSATQLGRVELTDDSIDEEPQVLFQRLEGYNNWINSTLIPVQNDNHLNGMIAYSSVFSGTSQDLLATYAYTWDQGSRHVAAGRGIPILPHSLFLKTKATGNEFLYPDENGELEIYESENIKASDFFKTYLSQADITNLIDYYNGVSSLERPLEYIKYTHNPTTCIINNIVDENGFAPNGASILRAPHHLIEKDKLYYYGGASASTSSNTRGVHLGEIVCISADGNTILEGPRSGITSGERTAGSTAFPTRDEFGDYHGKSAYIPIHIYKRVDRDSAWKLSGSLKPPQSLIDANTIIEEQGGGWSGFEGGLIDVWTNIWQGNSTVASSGYPTGYVTNKYIDISDDGNRVVICLPDPTFKLWTGTFDYVAGSWAATKQTTDTKYQENAGYKEISLSGDGKRLVGLVDNWTDGNCIVKIQEWNSSNGWQNRVSTSGDTGLMGRGGNFNDVVVNDPNSWSSQDNENFGAKKVCISSDGTRIAFVSGADYYPTTAAEVTSRVRVIELNSLGNWVYMANDGGDMISGLEYNATHATGIEISFSGDGNRIAVLEKGNLLGATPTCTIQVHEYSTRKQQGVIQGWIKIGGGVTPVGDFTSMLNPSISLNGDGTRLVVGSPTVDSSGYLGSSTYNTIYGNVGAGKVDIYQWDYNIEDWIVIHTIIRTDSDIAEVSTPSYSMGFGAYTSADDGSRLGASVSISRTGETFILGSPYKNSWSSTDGIEDIQEWGAYPQGQPLRRNMERGFSSIYDTDINIIPSLYNPGPKRNSGFKFATTNDIYNLINNSQKKLNHDITDFINLPKIGEPIPWFKQWKSVPSSARSPPQLTEYDNAHWAASDLKTKESLPLTRIIKRIEFQVGTQIWQSLEIDDINSINATELTESSYNRMCLQTSGYLQSDGKRLPPGNNPWVPGKSYQAIIPLPTLTKTVGHGLQNFTQISEDGYLITLAKRQEVKVKVFYSNFNDIFETENVSAMQGYYAPIYSNKNKQRGTGQYITNVPESWTPYAKLSTRLYAQHFIMAQNERNKLSSFTNFLQKKVKTSQNINKTFPSKLFPDMTISLDLGSLNLYSSHLIITTDFPGFSDKTKIPCLLSAELFINSESFSGIVHASLMKGIASKSLGLYSNQFNIDNNNLNLGYEHYIFPLASRAFGGSSLPLNRFDSIRLDLIYTAPNLDSNGLDMSKQANINVTCRGQTLITYNYGMSSIKMY